MIRKWKERRRHLGPETLTLDGAPDAWLKLYSAGNGIVLEYTYFLPATNGSHPLSDANQRVSRRIVPPEDYPRIGEIITEMHVTATLKRAAK